MELITSQAVPSGVALRVCGGVGGAAPGVVAALEILV